MVGVAYWSLFATLAKCHFIPHYAVFIHWRRLNICTEKKEIFVGLRVICMALRAVVSQCSFISHVLKLMTDILD